MKSLLDRFTHCIESYKELDDKITHIKKQNKKFKIEIEELKNRITLVQDSRLVFQNTIDEFYKQSIGELENLINLALTKIFFDRRLKIAISLTDGKDKALSFDLIDCESGLPEDLRDGSGQGVKSIISFMVLTHYLLNFNSPYIFADEQYSQLSEEYIGPFFDFVKELCNRKNLVFVLISHDLRILQYADQMIYVKKGRITTQNITNDIDLEEARGKVLQIVEEDINEK